jgi:Mobilization protein NikA
LAATARLTVMMAEDEKAALEAQAADARVSTAEFVRRRLFGRAQPEERAFLELLAELKPLVRSACKTVEADLADIRALRERTQDSDAAAAERARRELSGDELASIADRLQLRRHRAGDRRRKPRA